MSPTVPVTGPGATDDFWPIGGPLTLTPADAQLTVWPPAAPTPASGWAEVVADFWASAPGQGLQRAIRSRLDAQAVVYPPEPLRALNLTALRDVRVVILGQDPYHGPGQAEGLAFSVAPGLKLPPSLRNIFKELRRDDGAASVLAPPTHGSLRAWSERGVLLLNTCLTVEQGQAASHAGLGWETLTDALIDAVARQAQGCVWMLWGAHAQAKRERIDQQVRASGQDALILCANHPSPLSATRAPVPFIGCGHFGQARAWWAERGVTLDWRT